jgi:hypothetical protein
MGLKVAAIDIAADKLKLAQATGADLAVSRFSAHETPGSNIRPKRRSALFSMACAACRSASKILDAD